MSTCANSGSLLVPTASIFRAMIIAEVEEIGEEPESSWTLNFQPLVRQGGFYSFQRALATRKVLYPQFIKGSHYRGTFLRGITANVSYYLGVFPPKRRAEHYFRIRHGCAVRNFLRGCTFRRGAFYLETDLIGSDGRAVRHRRLKKSGTNTRKREFVPFRGARVTGSGGRKKEKNEAERTRVRICRKNAGAIGVLADHVIHRRVAKSKYCFEQGALLKHQLRADATKIARCSINRSSSFSFFRQHNPPGITSHRS